MATVIRPGTSSRQSNRPVAGFSQGATLGRFLLGLKARKQEQDRKIEERKVFGSAMSDLLSQTAPGFSSLSPEAQSRIGRSIASGKSNLRSVRSFFLDSAARQDQQQVAEATTQGLGVIADIALGNNPVFKGMDEAVQARVRQDAIKKLTANPELIAPILKDAEDRAALVQNIQQPGVLDKLMSLFDGGDGAPQDRIVSKSGGSAVAGDSAASGRPAISGDFSQLATRQQPQPEAPFSPQEKVLGRSVLGSQVSDRERQQKEAANARAFQGFGADQAAAGGLDFDLLSQVQGPDTFDPSKEKVLFKTRNATTGQNIFVIERGNEIISVDGLGNVMKRRSK